MDAGSLTRMTYNNSNGFTNNNGLGTPSAGFGARGSRVHNKRLSVALPPNIDPIHENTIDNHPTPRTSRSHLLAGLRTQPKTPAVPASAPYNQTQHTLQSLSASQWVDQTRLGNGAPQTATGASFNLGNQHSGNAGRQMYALPEQVLAPPSFYEQGDEMDPNVLQQMQMTSLFLAQRQQQLQHQLASITAAAGQFQGLNLNTNMQNVQMLQTIYGHPQQQITSPIEVQPGVYLVYNHAIQGYSYVYDENTHQQAQGTMSPSYQTQPSTTFAASARYSPPTPSVSVSPPPTDMPAPLRTRSFTPPKLSSTPPSALDEVKPLPPPSATAFRRGHKKASSLAINPGAGAAIDGMKTASAATFGSQRTVFPPTPMTGTFGPGAARAGEHPVRQPRGPPPLEELTTAPTSKYDGSKNFATRQRRRALNDLMKAGTFRRSVSHSDRGSPASEGEFNFGNNEESEELGSASNSSSRKMSPIGSEMKEKRSSQGSADGYFALSSASSSEGDDFKQPPTPATPVGGVVGAADRKSMLGGLLNAAEKRRSFIL